MNNTFTYTKITKRFYLANSDEYDEDGEDFEYEVSDEDLIDEIVNCIYDDYFNKGNARIEKIIKDFILDFDFIDELSEEYHDKLWEIFEDEAKEYYNE